MEDITGSYSWISILLVERFRYKCSYHFTMLVVSGVFCEFNEIFHINNLIHTLSLTHCIDTTYNMTRRCRNSEKGK